MEAWNDIGGGGGVDVEDLWHHRQQQQPHKFYQHDDDFDADYDHHDNDDSLDPQTPLQPPLEAEDDEVPRLTREQVLERMERVVADLVDQLHGTDDHDPSLPALPNGRLQHLAHARKVTSILLILSYSHALLTSRRTTTTREVYYQYCTHFRNAPECATALQAACHLLHVPHVTDLGLHASPKGWLHGNVQLYAWRRVVEATNDDDDDSLEGNPQEQQLVLQWDGRSHHDDPHGYPISAPTWVQPRQPLVVQTTARCILVIEHEGLFQRLVQDGLGADTILITGKGMPDWATRACLHRLWKTTNLPVYGLADANVYGYRILQCYASHESRYGVPVQWLGLRPSQVQALEDLPAAVFQQVSANDRTRTEKALEQCTDPRRRRELEGMLQSKVELEALHWLGGDFMADWLRTLLDYNHQHPPSEDDEVEADEVPWMQAI